MSDQTDGQRTNSKELLDLDATAQADLVRRGEVLPTELVQASIDAIERIDGQLDSILHKAFGQALDAAEQPVDKDAPFCGVPMVFKDQEQPVAGIPFSFAAFPFLKDKPWIGDHDGNFAADMRKAGAVFLGRANCSLGAFLPTHDIDAHTMPRNPFNPDHISGGSSSGSAAAVAARLVAIGHGGDGGGSIRMPASICGVVGMKPTRGRVSVGPDRSEVFHFGSAWSHEFAMTRSVRDTAGILAATQGWRPGDSMPMTNMPPIPSRADMDSRPLRIGLTNTPFPVGMDEVDAECAAAAERTLAMLEQLGHHVEVVDTYRYDLSTEEWAYGPPLGAHFTQMARLIDKASKLTGHEITEPDVGPQMWACAEIGRSSSLIGQLEFSEVLQKHAVGFDTWWAESGLDVLVTPTIPMLPPPMSEYLPPPHGTFEIPVDNPLAGIGVNGLLIPFTQLYNWTGQPAISLPLAESANGLPIGVQLAAARMQDEMLLRLSYDLEEAMPWAQRRPVVCASD
ncbi:MAG TPA: amidase [Mycobacteriales bacterium]|nr:amidase [Mycobacteriales bacterium]